MENLEIFSLSEQYSTTRLVSKKVPSAPEEKQCYSKTVLFLPSIDSRKGEGGLRTRGYFKVALPERPLITIITVVFNGSDFLEKSIASVIEQDYDNVEYIIIDGGSHDKTVEIIRKNEDVIDYWISEVDKGIYDAMNKGISLALGTYVLFLGADDVLQEKGVLSKASNCMASQKHPLIFGSVVYEKVPCQSSQKKQPKRVNSKLNWTILLHNTVHHQSCFYHRSVFSAWRYDPSLKLVADYELNLLIFKQKITPLKIDLIVSACSPYGASQQNFTLFRNETNLVRKRNIDNFLLRLVVSMMFEMKLLFFLTKRLMLSRKSLSHSGC